MNRRTYSLVILACILVAAVALLTAIRGPQRPVPMPDRVQAVASTLRCPVCSGLTVADSPSRLAAEMRRTIAADLAAGQTPDQIRTTFAASYGEWVVLEPPKRGLDLSIWATALIVLAGGVWALIATIRRLTRSAATEPLVQDRAKTAP